MENIQIESRTGIPYEEISTAITNGGLAEDGSGTRGHAVSLLAKKDWEGLLGTFGIQQDVAESLHEICTKAWGAYVSL